jgi:hypothetical protein
VPATAQPQRGVASSTRPTISLSDKKLFHAIAFYDIALADWDDALAFFATQANGAGSLAVVLDEFQYLCAAQPALPSIVQRHWDRWQRERTPVALVLSGSALSFMEGLLGRSAPLYGRATQRPFLAPLDYRDAAGFVRTTNPEALLRRYAMLGGTPQYQAWAGDRSVEASCAARCSRRASRSTRIPSTCCAKAKACAIRARTSRSCARSQAALDELRDAQAALGGKAVRARLAIFARRGFDPALRRRAAAEDVLLVTAAADLFA